ncbi:MAG: glycoside hydrolase family 16 protein [Elusimicrobia bacterium]|nr:glycoside hydrolase family 16 protein [Elusimicrobiota bacterium]
MILLAAALLLAAPPARAQAPSSWSLVWSDEFEDAAGAPPNPAKWGYDVGGDGWGNHELEFYCAPGAPSPCSAEAPNAVQDGRGRLVISAVRDAAGRWTSARLNTKGLAQFQYGRIEARMRLPAAAGLWPAFWLLGTDISTAGWPSCGEIDVMENVPANVPGGLGADVIKSTVHGPGYSGVGGVGRKTRFPDRVRVDDEYHVYGALWSPGRIRFYVDDWTKPFFTVTRKSVPKGKRWVFDHPFFLIMNLAVGGDWPKNPDATTPNPAKMYVDYVRVYRSAP